MSLPWIVSNRNVIDELLKQFHSYIQKKRVQSSNNYKFFNAIHFIYGFFLSILQCSHFLLMKSNCIGLDRMEWNFLNTFIEYISITFFIQYQNKPTFFFSKNMVTLFTWYLFQNVDFLVRHFVWSHLFDRLFVNRKKNCQMFSYFVDYTFHRNIRPFTKRTFLIECFSIHLCANEVHCEITIGNQIALVKRICHLLTLCNVE